MALNWYVVHTYSGFEDKVKTLVLERARQEGLEEKVSRVIIPTEKVITLKDRKKKESNRKFYPGYILVEMELDDQTWRLVNNTPKVTGFVGGARPVSLPDEEIEVVLQQIETGVTAVVKGQFEKGEGVRIIDGPFNSFMGTVDDVDMEHGRMKVMVSIFGRQTPVELAFSQAEKI